MSGMPGFSDVGLVVGEVRGIRVWSLSLYGGSLHSVSAPYTWEAGDLDARCLPTMAARNFFTAIRRSVFDESVPGGPNHVVAQLKCSCGFYAYYHPRSIEGDLNRYYEVTVGGIIEGWGRVTSGPKGFRTQHARIKAFIVPGHGDKPNPPWLRRAMVRLGLEDPPEKVDSVYPASAVARMRENYPGIPVFDDIASAVKAFPLSEPLRSEHGKRLRS